MQVEIEDGSLAFNAILWDNDGKLNITDLAEFISLFEKGVSKSEILDKHIDLINPFIDADKAIDMYRRFAKEARTVFNSYSNLKEYMQWWR